ncbi:MAG: hypothetical protein MUE85_14810 [Microscillaceae bacterium]|jgi:hypothetical protein|nr:hypothetical protein [Microscillaceae bacterium]
MKKIFLFCLGHILPYFLFAQFNQPIKLSLLQGYEQVYPVNVGKQGLLLLTQVSSSNWQLASYDFDFRNRWETQAIDLTQHTLASGFFDGEQFAYFLFQNKLKLKIIKASPQNSALEISEFVLPLAMQIKQFYWLGDAGLIMAKLDDEQNVLLKLQAGESKALLVSIFPQNNWDLEQIAWDQGFDQAFVHLKNKKLKQTQIKVFSPRLGIRDLKPTEEQRLSAAQQKMTWHKYAEENPFVLIPQAEGMIMAFAHPDPETTAMYISAKIFETETSSPLLEKQNLSKLTNNQINSTYFWRLEWWNEQDLLLIGRKQFSDLHRPKYAIYKLTFELKNNTMGKSVSGK